MREPAGESLEASHLDLVIYPHPVLRRKATPIPEVNDTVRLVAKQMLEIMRREEGIGLAAPQVGLAWRMFIVDVPADPKAKPPKGDFALLPVATDGPVVYINPVLTKPCGPIERSDTKVLEVVIALERSRDLVVGQRVMSYVRRAE